MSDIEQDDTLPMDGESIVDPPKLEAAPEPEVVETKGPQRGDDGKFKAKEKGETVEAPPASESSNVPLKALEDERRKRQELEQRFETLQQQMAQKPAEPAPSIWENEQEWQNHFGNQIVGQAVDQTTFRTSLYVSELMARQAHSDFNELWPDLNQFLVENPSVKEQALRDPHPWDAAYKSFKNHMTMKELGATSIDDLRASLRAELEAELKASAPRFPTSTVQDGSVAGRGGPVWSGMTPDKDILPMG